MGAEEHGADEWGMGPCNCWEPRGEQHWSDGRFSRGEIPGLTKAGENHGKPAQKQKLRGHPFEVAFYGVPGCVDGHFTSEPPVPH